MANDVEMGGWSELLHSSTKLVEQASPSTNFPPLQRSLDQLEMLSTKLKAKTLRAEAPSQSISATRLLAREGINAEQLARDLKSFELKTTFEDAFPSEATSVEEYLQQLHEMTIASSIQEAQKDNLRSFNKHMMQVLEDDWQKEKRDFLQSLSRLSSLPRRSSSLSTRPVLMSPSRHQHSALMSPSSRQHSALMSPSPHQQSLALLPVYENERSITEKKAMVYAETVRDLNESRSRKLPFKPATKFRAAYESLGADVGGGKSVTMQKIWHLVEALVGDYSKSRNVSRKMSLVIGAKKHLELGHEKYITDTIQSHSTLANLGGSIGNLNKVRAFLRVRLREYGILDFDSPESRRQPPIDTSWQQIYYCLRTGYYTEAIQVAQNSRSPHFTPLLSEYITTGGNVQTQISLTASEECEKMLKMLDRNNRPNYDRKKLVLYAIISGNKPLIEKITRDIPNLFTTIEDFLWFKLSCIRDPPVSATSSSFNFTPYTLQDLQIYLNKFEPGYYTKKGKDPLVYPYVLLLSVQFLEAVLYLSREGDKDEGFSIDGVHLAVALADEGVLLEGSGTGNSFSGVLMDACAEVAGVIRQYGSVYLRNGNVELALEYFVQAASAMGGGEKSTAETAGIDPQRKRNLMLKQLLTEILLKDGGVNLLLGFRGTGEEGELSKYLTDLRSRQMFLIDAARQCHEAGLYDKSVEIHKRVGAFGMALETVNKCLSDAICALARGKLDSDTRVASLLRSGDDVLEASRTFPEASGQDKEQLLEQQTVLRQLEAIYYIQKLSRGGNHLEALRELIKLNFLPLDPRSPNISTDVIKNLHNYVQACVPDLMRVCLTCLENVGDTDGSLRALKAKIGSIIANSMNMNWPQDLYEKFARSI